MKMKCTNNSMVFVVLSAMLMCWLSVGTIQAASDFPNKPIQLIVGWSAGGSEDMRSRALATKAAEVLGQPVVIVNKPGGSGTLGLNFTAKSKPDGYTISSASTSPILVTPFFQKLEYDAIKDFSYIAGTCTQPFVIAVRNDAPWKNIKELLDYVKKNPGKIKYGSPGQGHYCNIYMEVLAKSQGLSWAHIPFKGDVPNITALLGGHIPVIATSSAVIPYIKDGKLRLLAVVADSRIASFPDVPSLKEFGFKFDLRANEVLGICGPKGIPADVVKKLEDAFRAAVAGPDFKKVCEQLDNEIKFSDSQSFTKLIQELYPKMGDMIKQAYIKEAGN